jgi:hypothetical protein
VVLKVATPGPESPFWISQPRSEALQRAYAVTYQFPSQPGATSSARTRHVCPPSSGYDSVRKTLSDALPPIDPPPPTTLRRSGQVASTDQPENDCDGDVATTVCSPGIAAAGSAVTTCTTADPRIAQAAAVSKVSRRRPAMILCILCSYRNGCRRSGRRGACRHRFTVRS